MWGFVKTCGNVQGWNQNVNTTVNAREMLLNTCFLLILFSDWSDGSFCRFRGRWAGLSYNNFLKWNPRLKPKLNLVGITDTRLIPYLLFYCFSWSLFFQLGLNVVVYKITTTYRKSYKKKFLEKYDHQQPYKYYVRGCAP